MLRVIEQATRQKIELLELPTIEDINAKRISGFKSRIAETLTGEEWKKYLSIVTEYAQEYDTPPLDVAAALAFMSQGGRPFLLTAKAEEESAGQALERSKRWKSERRALTGEPGRHAEVREPRRARAPRETTEGASHDATAHRTESPRARVERPRPDRDTSRKPRVHRNDDEREPGMTRYRIEVGRNHMVKPGQIVGAIAGESGIDSSHIGKIILHEEFSTVDLPEEVFASSFGVLGKAWVAGRRLRISRFDPATPQDGKPEIPAHAADQHSAADEAGGEAAKASEHTAPKAAGPDKRRNAAFEKSGTGSHDSQKPAFRKAKEFEPRPEKTGAAKVWEKPAPKSGATRKESVKKAGWGHPKLKRSSK